MDDPSRAWPAWKFDMKREDLLTTLHDQYNTYTSPIQDPDAFYHDIFEISHNANSIAEFHHLADNRRHQRLHELNDALGSVSLEITANPALINMPQWQHAIQLFRTNSFDSLIHFFASYLPTDPNWHSSSHTSTHFISSAKSTPHKPDEEHRPNSTHETHLLTSAGDEDLQLAPPSLMPLSVLPDTAVTNQQVEQNDCIGIMTLAVASNISEFGPEHIRPREYNINIHDGKEATQFGDDVSTILALDHLETLVYPNCIGCNEILCPITTVASICSTGLTDTRLKRVKRDCPRELASTSIEAKGELPSLSRKRRKFDGIDFVQ